MKTVVSGQKSCELRVTLGPFYVSSGVRKGDELPVRKLAGNNGQHPTPNSQEPRAKVTR